MAKVFLSYNSSDRKFARSVETELKKYKHESVWGVDELIAGRGWGELMPERLGTADVVIALLTPKSKDNKSLWCEIGAARVLAHSEKRTAFLPVIKDLEVSPGYTGDTLILWERDYDEDDTGSRVPDLCKEIDRAIQAHLKALEVEDGRVERPKIFVSHRHKDHEIASALVKVLRAQFNLNDSDIRCTSVQPYRLPFGKNTGDRLRSEINDAQVVLGLLAPDTPESSYVMFELGAAWARGTYTCPLLCREANYDHIPGPIFDLAPARLSIASDCYQLLGDLKSELNLAENDAHSAELQKQIEELCAAAKIRDTSVSKENKGNSM